MLDKASKVSLIKATLETLLRFLSWIPLGYVWETGLIDTLVGRFLEAREFRNVTLKCLAEVGALQIGREYNEKFVVLFNLVMTSVVSQAVLLSSIIVNPDLSSRFAEQNDSTSHRHCHGLC